MSEIDRDEWEDQMIEEIDKMFRQMRMQIDKSELEQMMSKNREQ